MATYETPQRVLQDWISGINAGDIGTITAMYAEDAVLLPTFSNKRLKTPAERRGYFERLAAKGHLSVELHPRTLTVQPYSASLFGLSGIYCWHFDDDEGELLYFEARFTFTIDLGRAAPILHQHSSQIPRML
jgi:hypothetical protein